MRRVNLLALGAAGLVCLSGCARPQAPAPPQTQTAGGLNVSLTTSPSPPHTGDDTLIVTLTDAATGGAVGNANVTGTAAAVSPRLPGVVNSGRAQGNGVYNIPTRLSIATQYSVTLKIQRTGQPETDVVFTIEATQ